MKRNVRSAWRRLASDKLAMISLVVLVLFIVMAIITPWVSSRDDINPVNTGGNPMWASPSREFILGTDYLGRSVALQVMWGARVSLFVGLAAGSLDTRPPRLPGWALPGPRAMVPQPARPAPPPDEAGAAGEKRAGKTRRTRRRDSDAAQ